MPSSTSASPTSRVSDSRAAAAAAPRLRHPALALATKVVLAPWLVAQARATRGRALVMPEATGARRGRVGDGEGRACRVLIVGDSSAAGVGVAHQDQAVAGYLTRGLHRRLGRPVEWSLLARTGLTTARLLPFLRGAAPAAADVAIVISGVNDIIEQVPVRIAVRHRAALADWLLASGRARHVAFAPLPPVHLFPLLPEPLRRIAGDDARRHDLALARWAATRSDVSHAPIELELRDGMMAADGFHPGEPVYRACGEALADHVARKAPASVFAAAEGN